MATIKVFCWTATHTHRETNEAPERMGCWNAVCMAPAHNLNEVAIFQWKTATNDTNLVLAFSMNECERLCRCVAVRVTMSNNNTETICNCNGLLRSSLSLSLLLSILAESLGEWRENAFVVLYLIRWLLRIMPVLPYTLHTSGIVSVTIKCNELLYGEMSHL